MKRKRFKPKAGCQRPDPIALINRLTRRLAKLEKRIAKLEEEGTKRPVCRTRDPNLRLYRRGPRRPLP